MLNQILGETLVDPETGEILVEKGTEMTHDVLNELMPHLENGLNNVTYYPSEDGAITDPMTIQVIKVVSPKDPDRIVNVIGNGQITDDVKTITPLILFLLLVTS